MAYKYNILRCLVREHQETGTLLERVKNFLRAEGIRRQADGLSSEGLLVVSDLKVALECGIPNHFLIEEEALFNIAGEAGHGEFVEILLEDHKIIRGIVEELRPALVKAQEGTLGPGDWETLYRQGLALVIELANHAEKEDLGLMPILEEVIEEHTAEAIYKRYQSLKAGRQVTDR